MIQLKTLCIGDIVSAVNGQSPEGEARLSPPMRVVSIGNGAGGWVNLMIDPEQGDPFEYEPHEIRGVDITSDVLEKYGFQAYTHEKTAWLLDPDPYHRIWMFKGSNNWDFEYVNYGLGHNYVIHKCLINHIHELQHALRLAKVEKEIAV